MQHIYYIYIYIYIYIYYIIYIYIYIYNITHDTHRAIAEVYKIESQLDLINELKKKKKKKKSTKILIQCSLYFVVGTQNCLANLFSVTKFCEISSKLEYHGH